MGYHLYPTPAPQETAPAESLLNATGTRKNGFRRCIHAEDNRHVHQGAAALTPSSMIMPYSGQSANATSLSVYSQNDGLSCTLIRMRICDMPLECSPTPALQTILFHELKKN